MKETSWLVGGGAVILVIAFVYFIVLPREQMGDINFTAEAQCLEQVETEANSSATYFKTFTCFEYYGILNCYHLETKSGVCTKSTRYTRSLAEN